MSQITISPEFFSKARNDYRNWQWALLREFFQNSIDCGSTQVDVTIREAGGGCTTVIVANNGSPMTEDILVGKLLALGASGKDFADGSVGGFGKAKELLYFCWEAFKIHTGRLEVSGAGANYKLRRNAPHLEGTTSTITIPEECGADLLQQAKRFISLSNVRCRFTVNDEQVVGKMRRGYYRRDLPFGRVYTNKQASRLLVVRIGGTPMFTQTTKYDGCVVVELGGISSDVLMSNRDGLRWQQQAQLDEFLTDLITNKRKALKSKPIEYLRYRGNRVYCQGFAAQAAKHAAKHTAAKTVAARSVEEGGPSLGSVVTSGDTGQYDNRPVVERNYGQIRFNRDGSQPTPEQHQELVDAGVYVLASAFVIKNETGYKVKKQYRPDSPDFCKYAYRIMTIWTKLLVKLHEVYGWDDKFTVGFIFSDDEVLAQYEYTEEHGKVYYLNPVNIADGKYTRRYNYSPRRARGDLNQLAITAVHELVHGMGYLDHDENYANKLTDMAGLLLSHLPELISCYKK